MRHDTFARKLSFGLVLMLGAAVPALAQRETVIPQVADGAGVVRTKIDVRNLGNEPIAKLKIHWYRQDGSIWNLATSLGTGTELRLDIGANQVLRIETLSISEGAVAGYAVLRNTEGNPPKVADLRIGVSVFYEILSNGQVVDTVSVPASPATRRWSFPVEQDQAKRIYSGTAIVNLANASNTITLQMWNAFPPYGSEASNGGTFTFTLGPGEQRARFIGETGLFPDKATGSFKGTIVGSAERPVAVLGLLQTAVGGGVQYATLAPEYLDAIHTESMVYLADGMSLDADAPRSPYANVDDIASYDLLYQFISTTVRNFVPQTGAQLAQLGKLTVTEFNNLTVEDLVGKSYSSSSIDMNDFSGNLAAGFAIAIKTSAGRYAKIRIAQVASSGSAKDLGLQVFAYR